MSRMRRKGLSRVPLPGAAASNSRPLTASTNRNRPASTRIVHGEETAAPSWSVTVSVGVAVAPAGGLGQEMVPLAGSIVMPDGAFDKAYLYGNAPPMTAARMLYSSPG